VLVASFAEDACPAVCDLDGRCSLHHWLEALKSCVRLQPLAEKVFHITHRKCPSSCHLLLRRDVVSGQCSQFVAINCCIPDGNDSKDAKTQQIQWVLLATVASLCVWLLQLLIVGPAAYHQDLLDWVRRSGLPSSCLTLTNSGRLDVIQGVTAAVRAQPGWQGCYLLAADTGYVLEPGSSLSRLVEAAVIRNKDTTTSTVPFEGADLSQLVQVRWSSYHCWLRRCM